ncbi:MAG: alpha/beta hydrolase [Acidimicrobiales bacterium]
MPRNWRSFTAIVSVTIMSTLSCAQGADASKNQSPATVVNVPVKVISTSEGDVAYRAFGNGPPLLLIMGYAGTMETWDPHLIDQLGRDFRVIIFDNAGIGRSAVLRSVSIDSMADQTSALITALHLGSPDVLGWSMGSMIAQALAIRHPDQVHRLVLCATYPGTGGAIQPSRKDIAALTGNDPAGAQVDLFPADQDVAAASFSGSLAAYPASEPVSQSVIAHQASAIVAWWDGKDATGRRVHRIEAPTLVTDGANDRLDSVANDRDVANQISGSRLVLFPDAGHGFLFQEGVSFTYLVRTFLLGTPKPLNLKALRKHYEGGLTQVTSAGKVWLSKLKALTKKSTLRDIANIDLSLSDALGSFDQNLLTWGAGGPLNSATHAFVNAEEVGVNDVLAIGGQSDPSIKNLAKTSARQDRIIEKTENALRRDLGLPPLTETATTTTTTY